MAAFQVKAVRLRIIRGSLGDARVVRIGEFWPKVLSDRVGDCVFEIDNAGLLADVPISPDSFSRRGGDQLGGDVELFISHHDVADEHRIHPKLHAGSSRFNRLPFIAEYGVPGDYSFDARETAQLGDDSLCKAVAQIFHLLGAPGDLEGKHGDGADLFAASVFDRRRL
jgi:hypothetical protein